MLAARDPNGNQVANPQKFPNGFKAVADYIHSLGLKSGLYTAKGPNTCAGFAASCRHEAQDALQWASWGIDYVKDDSCSGCRNDDNLDYSTMWQAIEVSGRAMVLTVEGDPDDALMSRGGLGNAKRVGHDISPVFNSMLSLVDIGSGLWSYAHGSINKTFGGYFNDLDMIEVGNLPDFVCGADAAALARCQAHFTLWTIMKAPLILGNDIPDETSATFSVIANKEAIAVNQDSLGVQAKRVAVQAPSNSSLGPSNIDNIAVIGKCDAANPTQRWTFKNTSSGARDNLFLVQCDASDAFQQWAFVGPAGSQQLKNVGTGMCIDAYGQSDPGQVLACDSTKKSQQWQLQSSGHIAGAVNNACLDVYDFSGPDVYIGSCKVPGAQDSNQIFVPLPGGLLRTNSTGAPANSCMSVTAGPSGGVLQTTDASGNVYCLNNFNGAEGTWGGGGCGSSTRSNLFTPTPQTPNPPPTGPATYALVSSEGSSPNWNNQPGASGPWPSTRYIQGFGWGGTSFSWTLDLTTPSTTIMAVDHTGIIDDDLVGHVTAGGDFCLELVTGGMLEVWSGPLSGGRIAVALFNRSPGDDTIALRWADVGLAPGAAVTVRSIWDAADLGQKTGDFSLPVAAHATKYLVLSPA